MKQYTKHPSFKSMGLMADRLHKKFPRHSFLVTVDIWRFDTGIRSTKFQVSILPGDDGIECSIYYLHTWKSLIGCCSELLAREDISHA